MKLVAVKQCANALRKDRHVLAHIADEPFGTVRLMLKYVCERTAFQTGEQLEVISE